MRTSTLRLKWDGIKSQTSNPSLTPNQLLTWTPWVILNTNLPKFLLSDIHLLHNLISCGTADVMVEEAMLFTTKLSMNATPLATSCLGALKLHSTKKMEHATSIQKIALKLAPPDTKTTDQTTERDQWLIINSLGLPLILKIHSGTLSSSWLNRTQLSMKCILLYPMKKPVCKKNLPTLHQNQNSCGTADVMVEEAMLSTTKLSLSATFIATSCLGAPRWHSTKKMEHATSIQKIALKLAPLDTKTTDQLVIFWIWLMITAKPLKECSILITELSKHWPTQNLNSCITVDVMVEEAMLSMTKLSMNATPLATNLIGAHKSNSMKPMEHATWTQHHALRLLLLDTKAIDQLPIS